MVCPSRKKNTGSGKVLGRCIIILYSCTLGTGIVYIEQFQIHLGCKLSISLDTAEIWPQCLTTAAVHGFR